MVYGLPVQSCRHVPGFFEEVTNQLSLLPPCIPHSDWLLTLPTAQWILLTCSVPLTLARTIVYYCPYLVTLVELLSFSGFTSTFINEGIDLVNVSYFSGPLHSIWQEFSFWNEGGWELWNFGIHYNSIKWHRMYEWAWSYWASTSKHLTVGQQLKHVYTWFIA